MKIIQYLYSNFNKEIKNIILGFSFFQLLSIYIYNFLNERSLFYLYSNFSPFVDFTFIILTPYWLSKKKLEADDQKCRTPSWKIGFTINGTLLLLFIFFAFVDIIIKIILGGYVDIRSHTIGIAISTVTGTLAILILGAVSGWFAGRMR